MEEEEEDILNFLGSLRNISSADKEEIQVRHPLVLILLLLFRSSCSLFSVFCPFVIFSFLLSFSQKSESAAPVHPAPKNCLHVCLSFLFFSCHHYHHHRIVSFTFRGLLRTVVIPKNDGVGEVELSIDSLRQVFHLPLPHAAERLEVKESDLWEGTQSLGIAQWPFGEIWFVCFLFLLSFAFMLSFSLGCFD